VREFQKTEYTPATCIAQNQFASGGYAENLLKNEDLRLRWAKLRRAVIRRALFK
jgi:hypothetical protein